MAEPQTFHKLLADKGACSENVHQCDLVKHPFEDTAKKLLCVSLVLSAHLVPVLWSMAGRIWSHWRHLWQGWRGWVHLSWCWCFWRPCVILLCCKDFMHIIQFSDMYTLSLSLESESASSAMYAPVGTWGSGCRNVQWSCWLHWNGLVTWWISLALQAPQTTEFLEPGHCTTMIPTQTNIIPSLCY